MKLLDNGYIIKIDLLNIMRTQCERYFCTKCKMQKMERNVWHSYPSIQAASICQYPQFCSLLLIWLSIWHSIDCNSWIHCNTHSKLFQGQKVREHKYFVVFYKNWTISYTICNCATYFGPKTHLLNKKKWRTTHQLQYLTHNLIAWSSRTI